MKKLLAFVLVLGLASVASAAVTGQVGFRPVFSDPTGPGTDPSQPLEESDIIYIDIMMYSNQEYLGINSTGSIYLDLDLVGGAEFVGNQDYTYYPDFDYRAPTGPPDFLPEWTGWNQMNLIENPAGGLPRLEIGGGLPAGTIDWVITEAGAELMVFDHIGIHCLGQGDVELIVSSETVASALGLPVIASADTSYMLDVDDGALGGSLTIYQVPEPMTMTLLGLGGLALLRRRR